MTNEEAARALAVRYRKPMMEMLEDVIEERCYNLLLTVLNELFPPKPCTHYWEPIPPELKLEADPLTYNAQKVSVKCKHCGVTDE